MNITKVNFEEINVTLNQEFIIKLGEKYAPTFNDSPIFMIKTKHVYSRTVIDDSVFGGCKYIEETEYNTDIIKVYKVSNSWVAEMDGHFITDYKDYIVTHISMLEY